MDIEIKEIVEKIEKENISKEILSDLSQWFGLEESINQYIKSSQDKVFIGAFVDNKPVGFIVLNETSKDCCEIYVMGVKKEFHRLGLGSMLVEKYESMAKKLGYSYSQVKTVKFGLYKEYDVTNKFYIKMGYKELECFPNLWDENNPCQIYIKYLGD